MPHLNRSEAIKRTYFDGGYFSFRNITPYNVQMRIGNNRDFCRGCQKWHRINQDKHCTGCSRRIFI